MDRYGSPYVELTETSYIIGGGFISVVEYKGKGYFSGKPHSFKAVVTAAPGYGGSNTEHVIEGAWNQSSKFTKGGNKWPTPEFHNVSAPKEEVTVVGGDSNGEMGEFETRRLWKQVAKGIREGDFEAAGREKSRIEVCLNFRAKHLAYDQRRMINGNDVKMRLLPAPAGS